MCKALTYLLLLLLPFSSMGRPVGFSSGRLADLAVAAALAIPENPSGNRAVVSIVCQGRRVPVVVEYEAGTVVHIGLDLFGEAVKKENVLVYNFVERYLLESLLDSHSLRWDNMPAYGRIVTQGDLFSILQQGLERSSVQVSTDGEGMGRVEITADTGLSAFSVRFPTEIQLLTGEKKDELEKGFIRKVTGERKLKKKEIPRNLKRIDRDLYVAENGFFEIAEAQSSAFFRKRGLSFQPVCETSQPVESVMTLLTGYNRKKDYDVRMKFHQYGYQSVEKTVPLDYLIDSCLEDGCVPYVGIESRNEETVVATLFMVNRPFGYSHTFQFTVNPEIFDKPAGILYAKAYLYTPLYPKKS